MPGIDVIFVKLILTGRDKSSRSSLLHVLHSNRYFMNFCQMTYSMGCSRWLMLGMVQTMYLNFRLKPDVYAACG